MQSLNNPELRAEISQRTSQDLRRVALGNFPPRLPQIRT